MLEGPPLRSLGGSSLVLSLGMLEGSLFGTPIEKLEGSPLGLLLGMLEGIPFGLLEGSQLGIPWDAGRISAGVAKEDIFVVEARTSVRELAVVRGEREPHLGHISLVHAKAPEREELDVGVNVALVETPLHRAHGRAPPWPP